jgi:hypothetical protein
MRRGFLLVPVVFVIGCSQTAAPVLQPGDVVRPEVSFAPQSPWTEGASVAVGVLMRVERSGRDNVYLKDADVPLERTVMRARVTFLDGERLVEEPRDVSLVHDC